MKKKDIEVLTRVAERLEKLLPVGEYPLFMEYMEICDRYKEEYEKMAVNRINSITAWRKKNPDEAKRRQKEYEKTYRTKKATKSEVNQHG
jgi:hypothetical protein